MKLKPAFIVCLTVGLFTLSSCLYASDSTTQTNDVARFNSPQDAVNAMLAAAQNHDTNMGGIFGTEGHQLVSADAVQAAQAYDTFVHRVTEKITTVTNSDDNLTLLLGSDGWSFPIPLVKQGGQWFFDTDAGKQEILNRRIGMNELGAIAVCRTYVDAQREYASQDRDGDGVLNYAQFLHSDPNTHDGLFWPAQPGEELSPFGPLIAAAHAEGYEHTSRMMNEHLAPYHGYYFKILTRQGRHAPGGKYNYIINGHMIAGFALVAWPAEWGNTGIMTFIVNQQGKVYQCNLGKKTSKIASDMTTFDPDEHWTAVQ